MLEQVSQRAAAMEHILTDGDQLADYTNRYFTEVEPIDVDGGYETIEFNPYTPQYDQMPAVPAAATAGVGQVDPQTQWQTFNQVMNQNPEQAWRVLSRMTPDAMRSKLLFLDQA